MSVSGFLTNGSSPAPERLHAGIDRFFLDSVQGTFGGWGLTPQMLEIIVWTLASACAAAGLVILVNQLWFKPKRHVPSGAVEDPAQIDGLLLLALDQRSKVEFSFSRDDQAARPLHCSIEEVGEQAMVLDAGGFATAHQGWLGRPVTCYFRVQPRTGSGAPRFYNFESEVQGVVKRADESILISIALPTLLKLQQKRVHLRMEPPLQCLLGLAVWPESLDEKGRRECVIRRWGKPILVYHERETSQVHVVNVSAGGMRMDVPHAQLRALGRDFEVGERLVVLLKLLDPEKKTRQRLWCLSRVQNRFDDHQARTLELGLRFLAQGSPSGEEEPAVVWRKVGADGIDALGNWIQRRHLELYRSKGVS